MKTKPPARIVFSVVCTLLAAACSREPVPRAKSAVPAESAVETRSLRWMGHWKGEGRREELVRQVLEEFAFTHPEIDVSFKFAADVLPIRSQTEMGRYIADMIRENRWDWDVIWFDPLVYRSVAKELGDWNWGEKYLVDFSGIEAVAGRHKESLMQGPTAHQYTAGVMPGPYIEGFYYAIWYNRELAEKIGIEVKEEGMTPEDLLDYADQVRAYNLHAEQPVAFLLDYGGAGALRRLFVSLLRSARKDAAAPVGEADALARTLVVFEALKERFPSGSVLVRADLAQIAQSLIHEEALFFCDATWSYTVFEQVDPEGLKKLHLAQMPRFRDGVDEVVGGYITTWAVLKGSPGQDEGIELMKYWSRPEIAEEWVRRTKCPSGLVGNLYDPYYGNDGFAKYQRCLEESGFPEVSDPLMFQTELDDGVNWSSMEKIIAELTGEPYLDKEVH
ncbi:MAG: extracellular solute-binding protein [Pontiellaceae bacterium]|nr:extracellular solute-binding protein [Pontiellaceae bacterium]